MREKISFYGPYIIAALVFALCIATVVYFRVHPIKPGFLPLPTPVPATP
jgi:hypothetical protein